MGEAIREEQEKIIGHLAMLGFDAARLLYYMDFFAGNPTVDMAQRRYDRKSFGLYELQLDRREDGLCEPRGYRLRVIPYPELHYDKVAGIDIRQLEKKILAIDWEDAGLSAAGSAGDPRIARVFKDLDRLAGKEEGQRQARLLKEHFIYPGQQGWFTAGDRFWEIRGDRSDFHMREAFNLAAGRAVLKFEPAEGSSHSFRAQWKLLREGRLLTFPDYPLAGELRRMGVVEMAGGQGRLLVHELTIGEQVMANLTRGSGIQPVLLETDPEHKGIRCYDLSGNLLEVTGKKGLKQKDKHKSRLGR